MYSVGAAPSTRFSHSHPTLSIIRSSSPRGAGAYSYEHLALAHAPWGFDAKDALPQCHYCPTEYRPGHSLPSSYLTLSSPPQPCCLAFCLRHLLVLYTYGTHSRCCLFHHSTPSFTTIESTFVHSFCPSPSTSQRRLLIQNTFAYLLTRREVFHLPTYALAYEVQGCATLSSFLTFSIALWYPNCRGSRTLVHLHQSSLLPSINDTFSRLLWSSITCLLCPCSH